MMGEVQLIAWGQKCRCGEIRGGVFNCARIQQMFANVLILQQLALEIALHLKRNVDNPKGLHKVVK